ncbi:MAG TPA: transcriptional regulator NrdR [Patescibacteria group bacterium]|nr:transcriptional regulator NrdR [Patescibacteria group bacterium]
MCPYCGHDESNVLESRVSQEGKTTRRRRSCLSCSKRFTTYERIENVDLKVRKKDGRTEEYSRQKLLKCLEHACWRLTQEDREKMADEIEMKLLNWDDVEIPSREIGLLVMTTLKKVDPVAYLRFATVYLDVDTVEGVEKLVNDFKKGHKHGPAGKE